MLSSGRADVPKVITDRQQRLWACSACIVKIMADRKLFVRKFWLEKKIAERNVPDILSSS